MTKSWKERENQFNGEEINSFKQHSLDSYYLLYLVPKQYIKKKTIYPSWQPWRQTPTMT